MTDKKTVDNLLDIAQKMADEKLSKEKRKVTEQIQSELSEVKKALEMVKTGLCYKIAEDGGWVKRYVYATEEMLVEDYLSGPRNAYCRPGIAFETPDHSKPWATVFTVNGYRYYDMRYLLERYERDVYQEKERITRYNDSLQSMIDEFNRLVKEQSAIKKMLDDWTARQKGDGNAETSA